MDTFEYSRFSKQFLIGSDDVLGAHAAASLPRWKRTRFGQRLVVLYHRDLAVSRSVNPEREVLCLGHLLDSENPEADNVQIAGTLADALTDFRHFEDRLARLAGRWVVLGRCRDRAFLYHDACGLKSVFLYRNQRRNTACIGSFRTSPTARNRRSPPSRSRANWSAFSGRSCEIWRHPPAPAPDGRRRRVRGTIWGEPSMVVIRYVVAQRNPSV